MQIDVEIFPVRRYENSFNISPEHRQISQLSYKVTFLFCILIICFIQFTRVIGGHIVSEFGACAVRMSEISGHEKLSDSLKDKDVVLAGDGRHDTVVWAIQRNMGPILFSAARWD